MNHQENTTNAISRRGLLQAAAAAGIAAPLATAITPGGVSAQDEPKRGGTITLVTPQDFPGMDPALTALGNADNLHSLLWNGLTRYDDLNEVLPDLAESWESLDTQTVVFHLRQGVTFHNGREMTGEDVKANLERVLNPETASPYRGAIASIATIDLVDNYTIQLNLSAPDVTIPASIGSVKIQAPESFADAQTNPVGTGPYKFVEFVPGDHVSLTRFENYWNQPLPYADEFRIQITKDPVSAYNAFKSGQFDVIWQMDFSVVEEVQNNAELTLIAPQVTGTSLFFAVDCSQPPFDNKIARQALMYATDKQAIFDLAYFGVGFLSPTNSNLVENHWAFNPNLPPREYDIEKAKQLFAEAGVQPGTKWTFNAISGRQDIQTQAEILERSLNECGIELEIVATDIPGWAAVTADDVHWPNVISFKGQVQGWDPALQLAGLRCNDLGSNIWYCNEEVDALMEQGAATLDQEERKAIYWQVQEILYDEVPWVVYMLYTPDHASWAYIKGIYVDGRGQLHLDGAWTEK